MSDLKEKLFHREYNPPAEKLSCPCVVDKQIEEMAVELGVYACKKTPCKHCAVDYDCIWLEQATRLYNAGYRKASDVAREIFEEIERCFMYDGKYIGHISQRTFVELKKKYTEGGE